MFDQTTSRNASESVSKWKGHIKNVAPSAEFEADLIAEELPAKQQAEREAKILHENMVSATPKHEEVKAGPVMPTAAANSVYPDADRGLVSSQSQTPRFKFENVSQPESALPAQNGKKSFFQRIFRH